MSVSPLLPHQDDFFPFFTCAAEAALKGVKADEVEKVAHQCAIHAGLAPTKLMACYSGMQQQRPSTPRSQRLPLVHAWGLSHTCTHRTCARTATPTRHTGMDKHNREHTLSRPAPLPPQCPLGPAGQLGDSLQRLAAQRTASLKPAHKWVPWVVVNGIPLLEDDDNVSRGASLHAVHAMQWSSALTVFWPPLTPDGCSDDSARMLVSNSSGSSLKIYALAQGRPSSHHTSLNAAACCLYS